MDGPEECCKLVIFNGDTKLE